MPYSGHRRATRRALFVAAAALTIAASLPLAAGAAPGAQGFKTSRPAMLNVVASGGSATPLMTVGETLDGFRLEALPDGISFLATGNGAVDLYMNHETSRVPFPLANNGLDYIPTNNTTGSQNDFLNSQVSRIRLSRATAGVLNGTYVIDSPAGFQRLCSNFMATTEHGFRKPILFTNEEGVDWVKVSDPTFPAFPGDEDGRQIGVTVAYDVKAGVYQPIWGMGRFNHENTMPVPGYGHPVTLSGDDTFTTTAARSQSQLYMYEAASSTALWNDEGDLYAFVSDDATRQKYEQFTIGDTTTINGHFIKVPKLIATGRNPDGSELMRADVPNDDTDDISPNGPYPAPTDWQTFNGVGIDGPQWVLEHWSRANSVFGFIRVEDTAYDRRPGMSNHVYIVDSGRGTNAAVANGVSSNGRIWEMVLDPLHPSTGTATLRILIEGDDNPVKTPGEIHQPDNIESTVNGLYITEDPGSQQQFPFGAIDPNSGNYNPAATNGRLMQYKFSDSSVNVVAVIDQSLDELSGYDQDPVPAANHGFWEASGVIDASSVFGAGAFLITVQAHSLWVEGAEAPDDLTRLGGVWSYGGDGYPDWINKREGGQLLLIKIPGA